MNTTEIKEYKKLQSKIRKEREKLESFQLSLQVATEDLKGLNAIIAKTEVAVNLVEFEKCVVMLSKELERLEDTLKEDNKQLKKIDKRIEKHTLQVKTLKGELVTDEQELSTLRKKLQTAEGEKEPDKELIKSLTKQVRVASNKFDRKQAKVRKKQLELKTLSTELKILTKKIATLEVKKVSVE
jgi:chromosome segregation ATPase